jgi:hypothetical protein
LSSARHQKNWLLIPNLTAFLIRYISYPVLAFFYVSPSFLLRGTRFVLRVPGYELRGKEILTRNA